MKSTLFATLLLALHAAGLCLALMITVPLLAQTHKPVQGNLPSEIIVPESNDFLREIKGKGLYSKADPSLSASVPPELRQMEILTSPLMIISDEYHLGDWQESPSKIIYHDGWYHAWIIDIPLATRKATMQGNPARPNEGKTSTRYLKSKDLVTWLDQGRIVLGEKGSFDDKDRQAPDVVLHDGKFYMFYEAHTKSLEKYRAGSEAGRCGITCLVADRPEGPWRYAKDDMLLVPELDDPTAFDHCVVTNPQIEFFKGRWFMYYKALKYFLDDKNKPDGYATENAVAVADDILGPYRKYKGNPISRGHSAFVLKYKHGMIYFNAAPNRVFWTEDGFTFVDIGQYGLDKNGIKYNWSNFFVPNNPLYGGDVSLPDASEFHGISSSWRKEFGYHKFNNDIVGITLSLKSGRKTAR